MSNSTTYVGLDVHARSIKAVALNALTGELTVASFGYDATSLAEWIKAIDPKAKCVYESGVTGFDLQKKLSALDINCVVGAVSKMIKPLADKRRKNDRVDAEFLARLLSVGNICEVWVPDDECEAARDLSRALEDARCEVTRAKQMLSKFLLRHGYIFSETTPTGRRKKMWTHAHWEWIKQITFLQKADREVLAYYIDRVKAAIEEKKRLERLVVEEVSKPRWKTRCDSLKCLKGIDTQTAAALVFEAGEFSRFKNARSFAAWIGLTPSEHSSGETTHQGGITKTGNRHLRSCLIESSWHYLWCSPHQKELVKNQTPNIRARRHATKGIRRLVARREQMLAKGLNKNKANVATARELACWVWAIGCMVEAA